MELTLGKGGVISWNRWSSILRKETSGYFKPGKCKMRFFGKFGRFANSIAKLWKDNGNVWDHNYKKYAKESLEIIQQYQHLLDKTITLDPEFTLRDYFQMIVKYEWLQLLDGFFPGYIDEFQDIPKDQKCLADDMDYLEVYKSLHVHQIFRKDITIEEISGTGKTYDSELFTRFHGVKLQENDFPQGIAIEYSPLKDFLDMPLSLGPLHLCFGMQKDSIQLNTDYSLFEFVKAIIWELSWCGTPEKRDQKAKEFFEN